MDAKKMFQLMSDMDLLEWHQQYGRPQQACHYRKAPRRAAWNEIVRRGLQSAAQKMEDERAAYSLTRADLHGYNNVLNVGGRMFLWGIGGMKGRGPFNKLP